MKKTKKRHSEETTES